MSKSIHPHVQRAVCEVPRPSRASTRSCAWRANGSVSRASGLRLRTTMPMETLDEFSGQMPDGRGLPTQHASRMHLLGEARESELDFRRSTRGCRGGFQPHPVVGGQGTGPEAARDQRDERGVREERRRDLLLRGGIGGVQRRRDPRDHQRRHLVRRAPKSAMVRKTGPMNT